MSLNQNNMLTDSGGSGKKTAAQLKQALLEQMKDSAAPFTAQEKEPGGSGGAGRQTVTYIGSNGQRQVGVADFADPYWDAMRNYYQQAYESQIAANNAAADSAYDRAAQAAQEQRDALSAGYQGTNRQLYRDYMEQQRVLPQQLSAQGFSGGLTESSRLRLSNAYGENLAENERARLAQVSAIDSALAQQDYEARAAAAQANSQALQNRYANLAALRTQQYQTQRAEMENRAAQLAAAGDFSGYRALGYTDEDINYLARLWRAIHPELAPYQATGDSLPVYAAVLPDSTAASVARYIRSTQGAAQAIDYVAEELAAGHIFSDEAERLWKELKQNG